MDFATAQTLTGQYINDLPADTQALIPVWINDAVRDAEARHNFRHMEAEHTFTTAVAVHALGSKSALSREWKEARTAPWLQRDDGSRREVLWAPSQSEMVRQYSLDSLDKGAPEFVLETEAGFSVFPFPDGEADWAGGEYRLHLPYWAYSPELTNPADTNPVLNGDFGLYVVYFAAALGHVFNEDDERAAKYAGLGARYLQRAIGVDKRSRMPNRTTLVPRRDVYGPAIRPRR
jgi:hypothetical protein